ncbi:4855_t:CDS:2 [Funneliformis geosporum]|nr:4855_t:CDS:2 [Funneliformis geosporum]
MDEIPMTFNLLNNITVEQYNTRTVSILTTDYECFNLTVVLTCIADRIKLPPVIIFKLVNILCEEFSDSIIIRINKEVLDSFIVHKIDTVKN